MNYDVRQIGEWYDEVRETWEGFWKGKDHRYGRDFAAFLGERLMSDFRLHNRADTAQGQTNAD